MPPSCSIGEARITRLVYACKRAGKQGMMWMYGLGIGKVTGDIGALKNFMKTVCRRILRLNSILQSRGLATYLHILNVDNCKAKNSNIFEAVYSDSDEWERLSCHEMVGARKRERERESTYKCWWRTETSEWKCDMWCVTRPKTRSQAFTHFRASFCVAKHLVGWVKASVKWCEKTHSSKRPKKRKERRSERESGKAQGNRMPS